MKIESELYEARRIAKEACELLAKEGYQVNYPPMPWEEIQEFCDFFEDFNGFPINDDQKIMFDKYENNSTHLTFDVGSGVTTFMMTLAAWESLDDKNVIYFTCNKDSESKLRDIFDEKMNKYSDEKYSVEFVSINKNFNCPICKKYNIGLWDDTVGASNNNWNIVFPSFNNALRIKSSTLNIEK